jgi:hypothetical protein
MLYLRGAEKALLDLEVKRLKLNTKNKTLKAPLLLPPNPANSPAKLARSNSNASLIGSSSSNEGSALPPPLLRATTTASKAAVNVNSAANHVQSAISPRSKRLANSQSMDFSKSNLNSLQAKDSAVSSFSAINSSRSALRKPAVALSQAANKPNSLGISKSASVKFSSDNSSEVNSLVESLGGGIGGVSTKLAAKKLLSHVEKKRKEKLLQAELDQHNQPAEDAEDSDTNRNANNPVSSKIAAVTSSPSSANNSFPATKPVAPSRLKPPSQIAKSLKL